MSRIQEALAVLSHAMQEIFDEAPYARFLKRRQLQASRESYAEFIREQEQARARRPRCC